MTFKCLKSQSLCILRGQALDIEVPVINAETGAEADLAGATLDFGLALGRDSAYVHTLSASKAAHVITGQIDNALSEQLTEGEYYFSVWVTIAGASTPVAKGFLTVSNDSRTAS